MRRAGESGKRTGAHRGRPRLAFDGIPRDLNLTPAERRTLRRAAHTWLRTHRLGSGLISFRAAAIPGAVALAVFFSPSIIVPFVKSFPLKLAVPFLCFPPQLLAMRWAITRSRWPWMARALAAVGYEVCPTCGFDLSSLPHDEPCCPECGGERLRLTFLPGTPPPPPRPTLIAQAGESP
jgi:hypothetical protein